MREFLAEHLGVFDPEDIRILVRAFDKAWEAVQASGAVFGTKAKADMARAILAKHIIAAAKEGDLDEERLRDGALVVLAHSKSARNAVGLTPQFKSSAGEDEFRCLVRGQTAVSVPRFDGSLCHGAQHVLDRALF